MNFSEPISKKIAEKTRYQPVNFYLKPPLENLTLEEFECFAIERLQALRIIEFAAIKHRRNSEQYITALKSELKKINCKISVFIKPAEAEEKLRFDHISHFILRLAYCKSEDLRRWFLAQECDLFRARLMEHSAKIPLVLEEYHLNYPQEWIRLDGELGKFVNASTDEIFHNEADKFIYIYQVPFMEVLDLVQSCKVYLKNGIAYVTETQFISVLVNLFRLNLSHSLAVTARAVPAMEEDDRLLKILGSINESYLGKDYGKLASKNAGDVVPEMLDDLSKTSYPLCMRSLHESLRGNHHLKHSGRLQYGFFLKSIGLKLEDALKFWREEFTKKIDLDQFDKKYAYNIRHSFGTEGVRKNYSAYSCLKIITTNPPAAGDHHGCPFKHMDKSSLSSRLKNLNFPMKGIKEIVDLTSGGHYQIACTRYFELSHKSETLNKAINHPNEYFEESRKLVNGGITKNKVAPLENNANKNQIVRKPQVSSTPVNNSTQSNLPEINTVSPENMDTQIGLKETSKSITGSTNTVEMNLSDIPEDFDTDFPMDLI